MQNKPHEQNKPYDHLINWLKSKSFAVLVSTFLVNIASGMLTSRLLLPPALETLAVGGLEKLRDKLCKAGLSPQIVETAINISEITSGVVINSMSIDICIKLILGLVAVETIEQMVVILILVKFIHFLQNPSTLPNFKQTIEELIFLLESDWENPDFSYLKNSDGYMGKTLIFPNYIVQS